MEIIIVGNLRILHVLSAKVCWLAIYFLVAVRPHIWGILSTKAHNF